MSLVVKESLIKLRDGRLHLYQQNDSKNWLWRTFINGKYVVRSTKNDNLALARSIAEHEYDKLRFQTTTPNGTVAHSWDECERGFLNSLAHRESGRPVLARNYKVKLGILRQYFHTYPIHTIKTRDIHGYVQWRRHSYQPPYKNYHSQTVSDKTLRSDFLALRQVLKYAKEEEWITAIPGFPRLEVKPRPGGWFTQEELEKLFTHSHHLINQHDGVSDEENRQRVYTDCYMKWLLYTGMRVDEALRVQFQDVTVQDPDLLESLQDRCLFVLVKHGKLSYRKDPSEMIGLAPGVLAFSKLKEITPNWQPKDRLFDRNPRERVQELFAKAGVLYDERGQQRTAKSFRHTYIMRSLIAGVDTYVLAKNCRTSVKMIEEYYGSYLTARMKRLELTKMFAPVKLEGGE